MLGEKKIGNTVVPHFFQKKKKKKSFFGKKRSRYLISCLNFPLRSTKWSISLPPLLFGPVVIRAKEAGEEKRKKRCLTLNPRNPPISHCWKGGEGGGGGMIALPVPARSVHVSVRRRREKIPPPLSLLPRLCNRLGEGIVVVVYASKRLSR